MSASGAPLCTRWRAAGVRKGACRPEDADVLPKAMRLLEGDPEAHVRAMAIEVVEQDAYANLQDTT
jgi:hypothetical protein